MRRIKNLISVAIFLAIVVAIGFGVAHSTSPLLEVPRNAVNSAWTDISSDFKGIFNIFKDAMPDSILPDEPLSKPEEEQNTRPQEYNTATNGMEVHFIDVGQGDSILIINGEDAMLIDAGENNMGSTVKQYLKAHGVTKLKYIIGTHPDSDHIGGLDVIIENFQCDLCLLPDFEKNTATYRDVVDALEYTYTKRMVPNPGETYQLGDATFMILAPNNTYEDANNNSIVILLEHGAQRFLFMGDAEEESEADILASGRSVSANVIKLGHHGSHSSSTVDFIEAVSPQYAVISCATPENGGIYGHPHIETMQTLKDEGIQVFRTDKQGTVIAYSDGASITWSVDPTSDFSSGSGELPA